MMGIITVNGKQKVMVKKHIQMNIRAAVIAVLALSVLVSPQTFAQSTGGANKSTNVLKVSPVRTDIEIKPGESKVVKTTVENLTNSAVVVRPIQNDFVYVTHRIGQTL